jgi:hypothetical protein
MKRSKSEILLTQSTKLGVQHADVLPETTLLFLQVQQFTLDAGVLDGILRQLALLPVEDRTHEVQILTLLVKHLLDLLKLCKDIGKKRTKY